MPSLRVCFVIAQEQTHCRLDHDLAVQVAPGVLVQLLCLLYTSCGVAESTGQGDALVPAAMGELVSAGAQLAYHGGTYELVERGEEGVLQVLGTGSRTAGEEVGEREGGCDRLGGILE